jgi:pimeloyl-ACP methyl ester carboxylesterase
MHSYAVALDALEHDAHVDPNRVYLFGHSIGTVIAPRIVDNAAGIIAADGVGRNWIEYELTNTRRQLELDGKSPTEVETEMAKKELCMHRFLIEKQSPAGCDDYNRYPASDAYMQQVAALNIAEPWTKISVPVLVIYGTSDFVTAQEDHERLARIAKNATLKLIPGMDHYLDVAASQQDDWNLRVKQQSAGPYDADLSKAVVDWVLHPPPNAR